MHSSKPHRPKPGSRLPHSGRNETFITGLLALFAFVALGIAAPNFTRHAHAVGTTVAQVSTLAAAASTPTPPRAWDSTVRSGDDVFVDPESGAVVKAAMMPPR